MITLGFDKLRMCATSPGVSTGLMAVKVSPAAKAPKARTGNCNELGRCARTIGETTAPRLTAGSDAVTGVGRKPSGP